MNKLSCLSFCWCIALSCLSFCFCKMTSQTLEEKSLTNKFSILFFSTSFSFSSFSLLSSLSIEFFFYSSIFYYLLQPMLILTDLSWCHKLQLNFVSLMPQIKRTFINIECYKSKSWPSQKKMTRVHGSDTTIYFFHTLPCIEFDLCLTWMNTCR